MHKEETLNLAPALLCWSASRVWISKTEMRPFMIQ